MKFINGKPSSAVEPYEFTVEHLNSPTTRCVVTEIDYQRNGVSGEGFFVLRFQCSSSPERPLIGIVFDEAPRHVAVIDPYNLAEHFRGDVFEQGLRQAVAARYDTIWG